MFLRRACRRSKFIPDLNRVNKLGTGGKLSTAFGRLIHSLWYRRSGGTPLSEDGVSARRSTAAASSRPASQGYYATGRSSRNRATAAHGIGRDPAQFAAVVPTQFRDVVAQLWSQFAGNSQQDSHEFLSSILDALHEDLNHIPKKAARPLSIDDDGKSTDHQLARTVWKSHLERNRSIVVQLFHGLLKSEVRCKGCGFRSRKFEPFSYLSLPVNQPTIVVHFKYYAALSSSGGADSKRVGASSSSPTSALKQDAVEADAETKIDGSSAVSIVSPTTSGTATPDVHASPSNRQGEAAKRLVPQILSVELTTESLIGEFVMKCKVSV